MAKTQQHLYQHKIKDYFLRGEYNEFYQEIGLSGEFLESDLDLLDNFIVSRIPLGKEHFLPLSIPIGFYYGEIIIRNVPELKWRFKNNPKEWNDFLVKTKQTGDMKSIEFKPFSRVIRVYQKHNEYSLEGGFELLKNNLQTMISSVEEGMQKFVIRDKDSGKIFFGDVKEKSKG